MTAAIHGVTFVEAGPHTHVRRYDGSRPYWHCETWDGPCQGHGRPTPPPPVAPDPVDADERRRTARERFNHRLRRVA